MKTTTRNSLLLLANEHIYLLLSPLAKKNAVETRVSKRAPYEEFLIYLVVFVVVIKFAAVGLVQGVGEIAMDFITCHVVKR